VLPLDYFSAFLYSSCSTFFLCGAMVQRLARGPFKAKMRVRFPLALPKIAKLPNLKETFY
jgi:hypothetical protein